MDTNINSIIKYFSHSCIQFNDLFTTSLGANECDRNRYTAANFSGLVVTLSGEAKFSLNGETYNVNKNTMLHAGPNMLINIQTPENTGWEYCVIHYKNYNDVELLSTKSFTLDLSNNQKAEYFIHEIIKYNKIPGDLMVLKCQLNFFQFIETVLIDIKMQTANNYVDHAITYISENYAHPISVNEIADAVGCPQRKFAYMFEKQLGMPPLQYLTEYRLKQAKMLLRSTKLPIKEISDLVGYSDQYYFCRVFKKHYDMTPTKYRQLS